MAGAQRGSEGFKRFKNGRDSTDYLYDEII